MADRRLPAGIIVFFLSIQIVDGRSTGIQTECGSGLIKRFHLRSPICCHTVKCSKGQQFYFCSVDRGHDTCQNCRNGKTHDDHINTKNWEYFLDVCIKDIEDCKEYQDLAEVNGTCVCDVTRGYHGTDRNKCEIDDGSCKKAGHYLTLKGECKPCNDDYFKDEDDYSLCVKKTSCNKDQEIDDPGSITTDRKCRRKTNKSPGPTISPTITPSSPFDKDTHHKNEEINNKQENITDEEKDTERPGPEESNLTNSYTTLIIVCTIVVIAGLTAFVVYRYCASRQKRQTSCEPQNYQYTICANTCNLNVTSNGGQSEYNILNKGDLQVGNHNDMKSPCSDHGFNFERPTTELP